MAVPKIDFNSLDQLIQAVNSIDASTNRDEAVNFVADICRRNKELLEQKSGDLEQVLANANPEYSSALFIACIKAIWDVSTAKKQDPGCDRAADLLKTFLESGACIRDQIRVVPDLYLPLARNCVFHCLQKRANPFLAYDLGKAAVEAFIVEGENTLTSLTAATLAAAMKIGDFDEAMKYVYVPILNIVSELHPSQENIDVTSKRSRCAALPFFDPKYMLSYLFYCGLVTAKKSDYKLAMQFMEMCIVVPGSVGSQVQMDALKKFYVLSLIVTDDAILPNNRSPALLRIMKSKGRLDAYNNLIEAVKTPGNKVEAVSDVLHNKKSHFQQDNNWGLCQILVNTLRKKAVLCIAKSYSSIRLPILAQKAYCEQSHIVPFLKELESQGELSAVIDEANETVRMTVMEYPATKEDIMAKIEYVDYLRNEIQRLDVTAQMNPSHIIRTLRGVAGQLALMDDEGLSEAACPMDS